MAQPIVKYTLSKQGRVPEWLSTDSRAFAGEHSITGNKSGKIPRYEAPQDTIYLGIACGDNHLGIHPATLLFVAHSPENPVEIPARYSGCLPSGLSRYLITG